MLVMMKEQRYWLSVSRVRWGIVKRACQPWHFPLPTSNVTISLTIINALDYWMLMSSRKVIKIGHIVHSNDSMVADRWNLVENHHSYFSPKICYSKTDLLCQWTKFFIQWKTMSITKTAVFTVKGTNSWMVRLKNYRIFCILSSG